MARSSSEVVIEALGNFLKAQVSKLAQVTLDFPGPNQKLNYPALTIIQGKPKHTPVDQYILSKGAKIVSGVDAGKTPVARVTGKYDFTLQLDIWTRSKPERHELYDLIYQAFHKSSPSGISLQLSDYFNIWVRYDLVDHDFGTDEIESQKGEWRARLSVIANCDAVIEANEFLIETIENTLETPASIDSAPESPGDLTI